MSGAIMPMSRLVAGVVMCLLSVSCGGQSTDESGSTFTTTATPTTRGEIPLVVPSPT